MGTCNCVFFYFDTALQLDSWSDESHKARNTVMYGYIMILCIFYFDTALQLDSWSDESHKARNTVMYGYIMILCIFYFDTALQLVYLIAGVMDLIRFVILLCMSTLCNCVFYYFDTAL